MDPLVVWSNAELPPEAAALLREGVHPHRLVEAAAGRVSFGGRGVEDPGLTAADVAFGQPHPQQVIALPRLRLVHLTSAGYTPYDRDDLRAALRARGAALTKSSLVFDEPCAEHVLAFMTASARCLPAALENQRGGAAPGWPLRELRGRSRLLVGQRVLIYGMGSIGRRLCELLAPLRMEVAGVRRRVCGDEPVPTFALGDAEVGRRLAAADHVVNVLPASPETARFFDAARFAACKPGAVFHNIGRGTTVDQEALAAALASGRLAAAFLDVTDPEPLPPEHPLWRAPGCAITPHTAGGHADEALRLVRHFLDNLGRLGRGEPLLDRVV